MPMLQQKHVALDRKETRFQIVRPDRDLLEVRQNKKKESVWAKCQSDTETDTLRCSGPDLLMILGFTFYLLYLWFNPVESLEAELITKPTSNKTFHLFIIIKYNPKLSRIVCYIVPVFFVALP